MREILFTVFTPTYNRAHLLGRVFQSLKDQTFRDFEWIIVDDGSTDGTQDIVAQWVKEADFPIIYFWQPNSGKHVAINRGVARARGEFFVIIDSDDWLAPHALERFLYHWESIPPQARRGYAGVVGLYAYPSGQVVGTRFPAPVLDSNAVEIRTKYRVKGDKFEMYRTEVLKEFPFPENLGKFVPEGLVWNRIAKKYSLRFVNEVLGYKEYQPHGLSAQPLRFAIHTSTARRIYFQEFVEIDNLYIPFYIKLRACASYVRFSLHGKVPLRKQYAEISRKACYLLSFPIGLVAYLRDRIYLAKRGK